METVFVSCFHSTFCTIFIPDVFDMVSGLQLQATGACGASQALERLEAPSKIFAVPPSTDRNPIPVPKLWEQNIGLG